MDPQHCFTDIFGSYMRLAFDIMHQCCLKANKFETLERPCTPVKNTSCLHHDFSFAYQVSSRDVSSNRVEDKA
jgi:hypothetical protein